MYSIIRTKKHKSISQLKGRQTHTYRTRPTPNADPTKIDRNKLLFGRKDYGAFAKEKLDHYAENNHIRKDGVLAIEYMLTASPEFFDAGSKPERDERLKKWCDAQVDFITKKHGAENVCCMFLHMDEKTPHIEVFAIPIDPKGRLNCKYYLGGAKVLSDLQTAYADHNKAFALRRGIEGSKVSHTSIKQWYGMIDQPAEINTQAVQDAIQIDKPTVADMFNISQFLQDQRDKVLKNIIKLFKGTIYANKQMEKAEQLIQQTARRDKEKDTMKYKYEKEIDSLKDQAIKQLAVIQSLEDLQIDHADLRRAYDSLLNENNRLKRQYGLKDKKPEFA